MEIEFDQMAGDQRRAEAVIRRDGDAGPAGVTGRSGDSGRGLPLAHPLLQAGRRLVGEGQTEDLVLGVLPGADEAHDPFGHDRGLSSSGAGHDEQGRGRVVDSRRLLRRRDKRGHGAPTSRPSTWRGQRRWKAQWSQSAPTTGSKASSTMRSAAAAILASVCSAWPSVIGCSRSSPVRT